MKRISSDLWQKQLFERDEKGNVILHMTVTDDDGILSPFSKDATPVISSEVADFLESQTEALPSKTPLSLHMHGACIDHREQEVYRKAIKSYYTERYLSETYSFRRNLFVSLILAFLGVLTLAFAILTEIKTGSAIWTEVVDIIAWVLLWESVDVSLFRNHEIRENRRRYRAFLSMSVWFD